MIKHFLRCAVLVGPAWAIQTRSDPYQSADPQVRLAKQRLLSMDPKLPGIRFRVGDQLTRLVSVDASINNLESSVGAFQSALSNIAGVIDVPKANNGLASQMEEAQKNIRALSANLVSKHRQTSALINNLYNNAIALPPKLSVSLQGTLNNLVKVYNQQISTQVNTLERQRAQAVADAKSQIQTLSRSVSQVQTSQIARAMKMVQGIVNDRVDLLSKSVALNQKFVAALNVVNSAIAAVKQKSNQDLLKVQTIVGNNQKALQDYISQAGSTWMANFQNVITKASQDAAQALNSMSQSLSLQFASAKSTASRNLQAIDQAIDTATSSVNSDLNSNTRKLNLALQNITSYTNQLVAGLQGPVQDIRDEITTGQSLLSGTSQQANLAITGINSNATAVTDSLVAQFQAMARAIAGNPGFLALTKSVTDAYTSAQNTIAGAQTSAQSKVATLESQLGDRDNMVGTISSSLADLIDSQNKDFQTQTQVASSDLLAQLGSVNQRLSDMANGVAAQTDAVQANSDAQLADVVNRVMSQISASHDTAGTQVSNIAGQISQSQSHIASLIQAGLGGVVTDSGDILNKSSGLAGAAAAQANQLAGLSESLSTQNSFVLQNLQSVNSQLDSLRALGANAADEFYTSAMGSTNAAVNAFGQQANGAVADFTAGLQSKIGALSDSQDQLAALQAANANASAVMQAALNANLTTASNLLASINTNSTLSQAAVRAHVAKLVADFKSGSASQVAGLRQWVSQNLRNVTGDVSSQIGGATDRLGNVTNGLLANLGNYAGFVSEQMSGLKRASSNASAAIGDFQNLVDSAVGQLGALSTGLHVFSANASSFVSDQLNATNDILQDAQADAEQTLEAAWDQFHQVSSAVNGSTAMKLNQFRSAVNESIVTGDQIVQNFTNYINGMVQYEQQSAAARIAVQQGLLNSIIANALSNNGTSPGDSADLLERLQAVMGTASSAMNASKDGMANAQVAQQAMINMFGLTTASKVHNVLQALNSNANAFGAAVNGSSSASAAQSAQLLRSVGLGAQGVVDFASQISESVGAALSDASTNYAQTQAAMAALKSKTNDLGNITQSQLAAILQAMASSQTVYSSALSEAKQNNSANIAQLSQVISDFVILVNETLAASDDLIASVDTNYTDATEKLNAKMNTILRFISRESSSVAASADNSANELKSLLTSTGPIEDGIRQRLAALAAQQDTFATSVHDQLAGFVSRLADDNNKVANARLAATNKLYDTLHQASANFASNAATWQSQALAKNSSSLLETMSDAELARDVELRRMSV